MAARTEPEPEHGAPEPILKHNWSRLRRKTTVADPKHQGNHAYRLQVVCSNCDRKMTLDLTVENHSFYIKPEPALNPKLFTCRPSRTAGRGPGTRPHRPERKTITGDANTMTDHQGETVHHRPGTQANPVTEACRPQNNSPVKQAFHSFEQEVENISGQPAHHQPRKTAQAFRAALQEQTKTVCGIQSADLARKATEIWTRADQETQNLLCRKEN